MADPAKSVIEARDSLATEPAALTDRAADAGECEVNGHDIFICYSHDDRDWVKKVLIPRLTRAGLGYYVDFEHERSGLYADYLAEELKRSRYVVAVLTPSWVQKGWTYGEVAQILSRDPKGLRLVLLMPTKCDLPPLLDGHHYTNLTESNNWEERLDTALKELRVRRWFLSLAELCKRPKLAKAVALGHETLRSASKRISAIDLYKNLHDSIHEASVHCHVLAQLTPASGSQAADASCWNAVRASLPGLLAALERFSNTARQSGDEPERRAAARIESECHDLKAAVQARDAPRLAVAVGDIAIWLNRNLGHYNDLIYTQAVELELDRLIGKLEACRAQLASLPLDDQGMRLLDQFVGLDELKLSQKEWEVRLKNHDRLQTLTDGLDSESNRKFDEEARRDPLGVVSRWQRVVESLDALQPCDDDDRSSFQSLREHARAVIDALTIDRSVDRAWEEHGMVRSTLEMVFKTADDKLKSCSSQMWKGAGKGLQDLVAQLNPEEESLS